MRVLEAIRQKPVPRTSPRNFREFPPRSRPAELRHQKRAAGCAAAWPCTPRPLPCISGPLARRHPRRAWRSPRPRRARWRPWQPGARRRRPAWCSTTWPDREGPAAARRQTPGGSTGPGSGQHMDRTARTRRPASYRRRGSLELARQKPSRRCSRRPRRRRLRRRRLLPPLAPVLVPADAGRRLLPGGLGGRPVGGSPSPCAALAFDRDSFS